MARVSRSWSKTARCGISALVRGLWVLLLAAAFTASPVHAYMPCLMAVGEVIGNNHQPDVLPGHTAQAVKHHDELSAGEACPHHGGDSGTHPVSPVSCCVSGPAVIPPNGFHLIADAVPLRADRVGAIAMPVAPVPRVPTPPPRTLA